MTFTTNWSLINKTEWKHTRGSAVWMELQTGRREADLHAAFVTASPKNPTLFLVRWALSGSVGLVNLREATAAVASASGVGPDADEAMVGLWGGGQEVCSCEAGSDASAPELVQPCTEPFMRTPSSVHDSASVMIYVSGFHIWFSQDTTKLGAFNRMPPTL